MSKSDDIDRLRAAAAARKRSRSRERVPVPKQNSIISYAPDDYDETIREERSRQQQQKHKYDGKTAATRERQAPRSDDRTVIVQGLKPETDERQIYMFFAKCGKVRELQILKDNNSFKDRQS